MHNKVILILKGLLLHIIPTPNMSHGMLKPITIIARRVIDRRRYIHTYIHDNFIQVANLKD